MTKIDGRGQRKKLVHRNSTKEILSYENNLRCSPTLIYIATIPTKTAAADRRLFPQSNTGIVDSGATYL